MLEKYQFLPISMQRGLGLLRCPPSGKFKVTGAGGGGWRFAFSELAVHVVIKAGQIRSVIAKCRLAVQSGLAD